MSAYAATARIEQVRPRIAIGRPRADDAGFWVAEPEVQVDVAAVDDGDPLIDRLTSVGERWSQLTFYLFNAEGWR
jgi:hypothetical protein